MSIQSGDGVLEILDGTLKVSRLDIQDISGLDVGINTLARNMVLLRDDLTAAETPGGAVTSSTGVTRTQNTEIVFTGGYIYWPIKIPNAWTMKFDVYDNLIFSFANTSTPTSATASDNHGGYKMVFDSANARFSFYYQGSEIVATRTTYTTGQWSTVLINYEYGGISVVIDGEQVGNYALTHGEDAYTGEYIGFAGSATSKLKDIKLTNGDKWQYVDGSNASSIAYMNGNVGIGSSSPQKTLDVGGDVKISGNLMVSGTTFVVDQQNLSVKDKIIELGSENTDSSSNVGMIMTTGGSSNVAIGYRGEVGELMIGYTSNVAEDSELTPKDATNLPVKVYGDLDVTRDLSASTISGDGYLLSNVTLSQVVDYGNTTSNTVQFNATDVALKTVGNVAIGTTTAAIDLAIGDANTGLNQEGEDELAVYTAGSERIRVDSDGYVGISTSEPTANLHVVGAQYINDLPTGAGTSSYTHNVAPLTLTSASTTDTTATSVLNLTRPASSDTNVASRASFKVSRWSADTPTASRSRLDVSLASGAYTNEVTPLTLQANQKVGIMNTSPAHTLSVGSNLYVQDGGDTILTVLGNATVSNKLTIQGLRVSASAFDGLQATTEADNTTTYPIIINNSTASTSSTTGALIVSGGAGIGGSVYVGTNLDVNADVSVDGDTFNVNAADNRVGILTASPTHALDVRGAANVQALTATTLNVKNSNLVVSDTSGFVGIGTDSPFARLDVHGTANVGTLTSTSSVVTGTASISGNVAVNTDTLFVDSVNSRVGVGTTEPSQAFEVSGNVQVGTANLFVDTTSGNVGIGMTDPSHNLDIVSEMNLRSVSNTASIKYNSNVVTEYVRSKKLIKYPRVKMTAATTSGYTASASSESDGTTSGQAWRAFDGVAGGERGYHSASGTYSSGVYIGTASVTDVNNTVYDGEWIKLQLPTGEKIKVMGAYFYPRSGTYPYRIPYKGYILGSNTGANGSWNLISAFNSVTTSASDIHPGVHMFENNTNEYYNHIALVANEVYPSGSVGDVLNFAELEYFAIPEYDPDARGTDVIMRSVPNVPNTDWLEFYYDAKDLSDGSISSVTDLKPSGTAVNGTVNGSVSVSNGAFTFNGSTDYIRGTLNSVLPDYTFSLWINADEQVETGFVGIFEMGTRSNNTSTGLYLTSSGKLIHLSYGNNLESSHKVQRGWLHIICTYSKGDRTIYVNGEMIAFDNYGLLTPSGTQFTIGANNGGGINSGESVGQFFTGSIANFRLFNRILSGTEIQELYSYQKEYFSVSPNVLTFKNGCLGVGTNEPKATLDVVGTFQCGNSPLKFYHIQGQHVTSAGNHSIPRPADMSDVIISITGVTYNSNEDAVPFERHGESASWETDVYYDISATAFVINNQGSAALGKPFSLFVVTL